MSNVSQWSTVAANNKAEPEKQQTIERTMEALQSAPEIFTPAELRQLERALKGQGASFSATLDRLMGNKNFAAKIEAPR